MGDSSVRIRMGMTAGIVTFVLAACDPTPFQAGTDSHPETSSTVTGERFGYLDGGPVRTLEDRFADVARDSPGFGGFFQDPVDGRFYAYTTDIAPIAALQEALERHLGSGEGRFPEVTAVQGEFDFRDLVAWRRSIHEAGGDLITMTSVMDAENRVLIGVTDEGAVSTVTGLLPELGVHPGAVEIRAIASPEIHLRALRRPVVGGTKVLVRADTADWCTMTGAAVRELPSGQYDLFPPRYVMTNSHCTQVFGQNTNGRIVQPLLPDSIGSEFSDPPLNVQHPDCPPQANCRLSDAALFVLYGGPGGGHIPYHWNAAATASGVTFTGTQSYSGLQLSWWAGQSVTKMGASTGQTSGTVVNPCIFFDIPNQAPFNPARRMICQVTATYASGPGDSGAPVWYTAQDQGRRLLGINWGRIPGEGVAVFSLMLYARSEIANDIGQQHGQAWTPALTSGPHFQSP